jgi:hypothetical protein
MATRSRLGRDPLQAAQKTAAPKSAASGRKAKAGGPATGGRTKTSAAAPAPVAMPQEVVSPANPDQQAEAVSAAMPDQLTEATAAATPDQPAEPVLSTPPGQVSETASEQPAVAVPEAMPFHMAEEMPAARQATPAEAAIPPVPDQMPEATPCSSAAATEPETSGLASPQPAMAAPPAASLAEESGPDVAQKASVSPASVQSGTAPGQIAPSPSSETNQTVFPDQNAACLPDQESHPVAVFLRGVLEGLLPEGETALCVEVDQETFNLPVEKLFYFSHALQRIATVLENVAGSEWRPGTPAGPLPVLTARLRPIGRGRHALTLHDNGAYFKGRLPGLSLGLEALRPLVAFVVKRQGSITLSQGRATAFEIIG